MKWIYGHKEEGIWWFRLFGYGLHGKNTTKHPLLFSERYGYKKFIRIGNWIFGVLKPRKIKF